MTSYFTNNTNQALHILCLHYLSVITSHCYLLHLNSYLLLLHIELLDIPSDVRHNPASGPLHLWFPLSQRLFSQISTYLTLSSFRFFLKCHFLSKDFPDLHRLQSSHFAPGHHPNLLYLHFCLIFLHCLFLL